MKRSDSGAARPSDHNTVAAPLQLKPGKVYRDSILTEPLGPITAVSTEGEPIYISKSYAAIGESPCAVHLPHATLMASISADGEILAGLCNNGQILFYQKAVTGSIIEQASFFAPPNMKSMPAYTAVVSGGGQRCIAIIGSAVLQTVIVCGGTCHVEPRTGAIANVTGNLTNIVLDASRLFYHVSYDTGEWFQVLPDGEISKRASLNISETLLAADACRAFYLTKTGKEMTLHHGAHKHPLPLYVNENERVAPLWGGTNRLYLQIGCADLVPALTSVELFTGAVLDTLFPTGVAPGTQREYQCMMTNVGTLVYNNGVYALA